MTSSAAHNEGYLQSLPEDRREAIEKLRAAIAQNIDSAYEVREGASGISYVVPLGLFPAGYHCTPNTPLGYMSVASQKNVISVHHMGMYSNKQLLDWFVAEYPKHTKARLDMGKSCIRFKKAADIPYELIGQLAGKLTALQWIDTYGKALDGARKR